MMSGEHEVVVGVHMQIMYWMSSLSTPPLGKTSDIYAIENTLSLTGKKLTGLVAERISMRL